MSHVNYWLVALSFLLGLVLTLAFMIRRVRREVPVYDSAKFASKSGSSAKVAPQAEAQSDEPKTEAFARLTADEPKTEVIRRSSGDEPKTEVISVPAAAGGAAGLAGAAGLVGSGKGSGDASGEEPYGAGSFRLVGGGSVPSGWTIKGNEDSMLYHSPESSAYDMTVAEIWFRDVPTAEAAGFNRWDSGKSQRGKK